MADLLPELKSAPSRHARLSGDERRALLVGSTLDVIAEEGMHSATLRRVAERAGVTNGLIRHHFSSKNQMILDSYAEVIARMTGPCRAVLARESADPKRRLADFVRASLDASVVEPRLFSAWACFIALVHVDSDFERVHREGYLDFQAEIGPLIAAALASEGRHASADEVTDLTIQLNALMDGLWIEGCLLPHVLSPSRVVALALEGAGRIMGMDLEGA